MKDPSRAEVEAAARAIVGAAFAADETEDELWHSYEPHARAALLAAAEVREREWGPSHTSQERNMIRGATSRTKIARGEKVIEQIDRLEAEIERLRAALKAMYDRYATDDDGWEVEPECHLLARRELGLDEQSPPTCNNS